MTNAHVLRCATIGAVALVIAGCGSSGITSISQQMVSANASRSENPVAPAKRGKVKLFIDDYDDPVPAGIAAGPDGALWFSDPGNDTIGRMSTHGAFSFFRAGAEVSTGITAGPDGALWFTVAQEDAMIGRVTTGGQVTLFKDPGGSFPQGIAAGPDGALWFGEINGTIGRITTAGTVTHFTVASSNSTIADIVTGPDGALWATRSQDGSHASNEIIRLTTSGKLKSFTVGEEPQYICVGPDKALWFGEANAIGRITTKGAYRAFRIHSRSSFPEGIAAGPDGALWFALDGAGSIVRLTTAGKMTSYGVSGSAPELAQITAGPDHSMWFTVSMFPPALGRISTR
jgi:virginiamycin B lyase